MFSAFDQENLTHTHHTTAANKPLNQSIRALQPKTPGPASKTPFRARNDENAPLNTGKAAKNAFVTPGPAPQTTKRAPLGAKTTNVKATAFQTPAPGQKLKQPEQTTKKPISSARRSIKKKIYVEPEPVTEPITQQAEAEEDDEPDFGYAPPPITPLPDPPINFEGITYDALKPENFNRGIGEVYFQSPKDENGFSIALKKQEEQHKKTLEDDLAHTLEEPARRTPDQELETILRTGTKKPKPTQESKVNTIKARTASAALSQPSAPRTHQRLPSAATRETAASKQKRKAFAVSRDEEIPTTSTISPRKFVQLYGEPPVESEMWFRLMELEIKDRHRGETEEHESDEGIFDVELDDDLDQRLGVHFDGVEDGEDFELTL